MKAIEVFERNLESTALFTRRVEAMSKFLAPNCPENLPKSIPPEIKKFISYDENHFDKIFEFGFIGLFANFEYFMYDFLRELYVKYPNSIPVEKTIRAEDVMHFKSYKSIKDFLIDTIAIENSYDLEIWNNTVQKLFNLKPISDEIKVRLLILNSMRNLLMHSGGHWNSKAFKDSKKIEKLLYLGKEGKKADSGVSKKRIFNTSKSALTPTIAYNMAINCFHQIIYDLKNQVKKKQTRKDKVKSES